MAKIDLAHVQHLASRVQPICKSEFTWLSLQILFVDEVSMIIISGVADPQSGAQILSLSQGGFDPLAQT